MFVGVSYPTMTPVYIRQCVERRETIRFKVLAETCHAFSEMDTWVHTDGSCWALVRGLRKGHHRRCWWILANFHDAVTEMSQVNNQKPKRVFQWTKASNSWDSLALDTTIPVVSMFVPRPVICHGGASNLWGGMEKIIRPCLAVQKIIERFEDIPTHPTNNRYNTNDNIQFESRAMRHGLRSRQYCFNRIHQNKRVCYSVASSDVTIGWSKYGDLCLQSNMPNVTGDVEGSQRPMQIGVSTWDESQRWDAYEFYRGCNQTLRSKMIQNQIHKSAMNSAEKN